eukprot:CAMPEP_0202033154 /NCGR_PEP_ID=MMETSP0905-20130828/65899_1 /ASSEMBLY_ACC=CAM_ASM_000554 /TAXON_ID=420261 /ORGANISM="Thalassiosira antarctica, Strain CCMP982" /LENGTH=175 /DNA_ID=CAMNT_0048597045 /DNA_START=1807 /DNA_END=2334 /DNA_ORIENTATION=+
MPDQVKVYCKGDGNWKTRVHPIYGEAAGNEFRYSTVALSSDDSFCHCGQIELWQRQIFSQAMWRFTDGMKPLQTTNRKGRSAKNKHPIIGSLFQWQNTITPIFGIGAPGWEYYDEGSMPDQVKVHCKGDGNWKTRVQPIYGEAAGNEFGYSTVRWYGFRHCGGQIKQWQRQIFRP